MQVTDQRERFTLHILWLVGVGDFDKFIQYIIFQVLQKILDIPVMQIKGSQFYVRNSSHRCIVTVPHLVRYPEDHAVCPSGDIYRTASDNEFMV